MRLKLIDIHCHLDFPDFDKDRDALIKRTLARDIGMITVGTDENSSVRAVEIAKKYEGVFSTVGVHPHDADKKWNGALFKKIARFEEVVAIGECGMDNVRSKTKPGEQKDIFKRQIELALEVDKPLMIHCREAHNEVIDILKEYPDARGNVHFFSGDWFTAQKYLEMGFTFSFTGVITFTGQYDEIIEKLPIEKIMVETDAPFVAPVPHRGKRCEPSYVEYTAKRVGEIKGLSIGDIFQKTTKNAIKFFKLNSLQN